MKIAIVGAGIAGLTCARALSRRHRITVLEANDYAGGHANTVLVTEGERTVAVDTGFIVFNEPNYPNLCRLFDSLGVESCESDMSFSVRCERSGIEYNGADLDRLFVQRRNVLRPGHWGMLADILRFHREAPRELAAGVADAETLAQFIARRGYGEAFTERYLVPLGASLWSCPAPRFRDFPVRFVLEFLHNHRMLQVDGRPIWRTVVGGSRDYVRRLTQPFRDCIRLADPVRSVRRAAAGVEIELASGTIERFDEAVLACHADQSLALLDRHDELEHEVLACFPYQENEAVLHTDVRLLPDRRRAWASWNYRVPREEHAHVSVTYHMNMLQGLDAARTYCVSLNPGDSVDPGRVIRRIRYDHPLFTTGRSQAQSRHGELVRRRGISYCGAYWGYGFHEDGVRSALAVCEAFDADLAHISHHGAQRGRGDARRCKARERKGAQAYLDGTSSTLSERNAADAGRSASAGVGW